MTNTTGYAVTMTDRSYKEITFNRIKEQMKATGLHGKVTLDWVYDGVLINLNGECCARYDNVAQKLFIIAESSTVYEEQCLA